MSETEIETAIVKSGSIAKDARRPARGPAAQRQGCGKALRGGAIACGFMLAVLAPVSVDIPAGGFSVNQALAGNGEGNYGRGKGNGGPNGGVPGKGRGKEKGLGDDPSTAPTPATPGSPQDDSRDGAADDAAGMADAEFTDAVQAVADVPSEGSTAAVAGIPTISQLFALGDESTVSAQDELELIANGWRAEN